MNFKDAARFFDKDPVYDAYTGVLLFKAHTEPHDDHTSAGATSRRRTMTTVPTTVAPPRGAVKLYGEYWLVGGSNSDTHNGSDVRRSYDLKKSTGLVTKYTPGQACLATGGSSMHANKEYFRDVTDTVSSSDIDTMWTVFCPFSENVVKGTFFKDRTGYMRVRNIYRSIEGLDVAETDQFDSDAAQSAVFETAATLDLVTDTFTSTPVTTTVIQTDTQKFYKFRTEAESPAKPGDRTVFLAKSALTPAVSNNFTMMGATWRVVEVVSELDAWAVLARLA